MKVANILSTMARRDVSETSDKEIGESLSCGDSWLHKWLNHEGPSSECVLNCVAVEHLSAGTSIEELEQMFGQVGLLRFAGFADVWICGLAVVRLWGLRDS